MQYGSTYHAYDMHVHLLFQIYNHNMLSDVFMYFRKFCCQLLSSVATKKVKSLSHVRLFVTSWTVAHQAPPSMEFSRQEYGVGCRFLLQGIFLTQGSNLGLQPCRQTLYHLSHQGSPSVGTKYPQIRF